MAASRINQSGCVQIKHFASIFFCYDLEKSWPSVPLKPNPIFLSWPGKYDPLYPKLTPSSGVLLAVENPLWGKGISSTVQLILMSFVDWGFCLWYSFISLLSSKFS
jgi:hypothetical protein